MNQVEIFEQIIQRIPEMSKSQKKIADYLIKNPDSAPFLTASKLAKLTNVGEATVVRFAMFLGYQGYPDMQRHLQEALKRQWTTVERLQASSDEGDEDRSVLQEILHDDLANLQATIHHINTEQFINAVQAIVEAENIYIIAFRSAASIGSFLEFYLDLILQNTELIRQADGISERLLGISDKDLVIGIGFSRYTRRTVEVLKYAKDKGANTLCITDHMLSPLVPYSSFRLYAATDINSFINSFTAPLSIINALITAVSRSQQEKVRNRLEELEDLWDSFHVFYHHSKDNYRDKKK